MIKNVRIQNESLISANKWSYMTHWKVAVNTHHILRDRDLECFYFNMFSVVNIITVTPKEYKIWDKCASEWRLKNDSLNKDAIMITINVDTSRPKQNGATLQMTLSNAFLEWKCLNLNSKFVPRCSVNNILELVQIMAWHQPGDKPLSDIIWDRVIYYLGF